MGNTKVIFRGGVLIFGECEKDFLGSHLNCNPLRSGKKFVFSKRNQSVENENFKTFGLKNEREARYVWAYFILGQTCVKYSNVEKGLSSSVPSLEERPNENLKNTRNQQ